MENGFIFWNSCLSYGISRKYCKNYASHKRCVEFYSKNPKMGGHKKVILGSKLTQLSTTEYTLQSAVYCIVSFVKPFVMSICRFIGFLMANWPQTLRFYILDLHFAQTVALFATSKASTTYLYYEKYIFDIVSFVKPFVLSICGFRVSQMANWLQTWRFWPQFWAKWRSKIQNRKFWGKFYIWNTINGIQNGFSNETITKCSLQGINRIWTLTNVQKG